MSTNRTNRLTLLPWTAAGSLALVVVLTWHLLDRQEQIHSQEMAENAAQLVVTLLRRDLESRFTALEHLASHWELAEGANRSDWEEDAGIYFRHQPGYRAIHWADDELNIHWTVSVNDEDEVRDLDLSSMAATLQPALQANSTAHSVLTKTYPADTNGPEFTIFFPLYQQQSFSGLLIATHRVNPWLDAVLMQNTDANYQASVAIDTTPVYGLPVIPGVGNNAASIEKSFDLLNHTWTIGIVPADDYPPAVYFRMSTMVLISGLLLSVLLGMTIQHAMSAKRQNRLLEESTRHQATLLKNLPGIAYQCLNQPNWPARFISEGCRKLCGYSKKEFEEHHVFWADLVHPDDRETLWRSVQDSVDKNDQFEFEYRITTRDGEERWMWTRGRAIKSEHSDPVILEGLTTDITARKQSQTDLAVAEQEARELRERLAHVDRVNMLGEMTTGIAHEINQPLSAISMYAQSGIRLLEGTPPRPERLREALEKLSAQASRAGAIIERIQQLGKERESAFEPIDCNKLVTKLLVLANSVARSHEIEIELDLCPETHDCQGDPVQIQQVILHLLRNGVEAMEQNKFINGKRMVLRTRCAEEGFIVSVIDSGVGISDAMAEGLFQPFTSSKEQGLGMSLSICSAIIRSHGGTLVFTPNEQGGATFSFTLPYSTRKTP